MPDSVLDVCDLAVTNYLEEYEAAHSYYELGVETQDKSTMREGKFRKLDTL